MIGPSVTSRLVQLEDIEPLVELRKILINAGDAYYAAKNQEDDDAWQASYRQWLHEYVVSTPSNIHVTLFCDDNHPEKIRGCAIGIIDNRVPFVGALNGKVGWVQSAVVSPDYQGRGIAVQMMQELLAWFSLSDVQQVALQTTDVARRLYEKLDFKQSGQALLIKSIDLVNDLGRVE